MNKHLLIVNLQKQFADKYDSNRCYNKCLEYIQNYKKKYDSIVATLFKQDNDNTNFKEHLNLNEYMNTSIDDLEFYNEIKESTDITIITTNGYGDASEDQYLTHSCFDKNDQIDIIGCDADTSVMAICGQLWNAGFRNIRILTDYIYTTADELSEINRETWINMLKRNFGDCVIVPKRRISFDATFIAPQKTIEYKGKTYSADIALYFEYQLIYGNGEEIYLEPDIQNISTPPCSFYIDKQNGYRIEYKNTNNKCYNVADIYPKEAFLWSANQLSSYPELIPFKDAVQLLKDNFELYNTTNNQPAQNLSYCIIELE